VSFGYRSEVPVLRNISLVAEPGQTIALVGPTGAGQDHPHQPAVALYDVDNGASALTGATSANSRAPTCVRQLGVVLQDPFLFAETVMENIRYGRLNATDEEVIAAAQLANADHFVRRLPEGYDTLLSERAAT